MADDTTGQTIATPPKADVSSTQPETSEIAPEVAGTSEAATTEAGKPEDPVADTEASAAPEEPASDKPTDTNTGDGDTTAEKPATEDTAASANGATDKKNQKRKSTSGVPEHKAKKLNKKKSMADLHLDVYPGQLWFARTKGHPPWPAIICDEEMLPESLLAKRPVSAMRTDGSWREDFLPGGKNARDRRYPIMFLGTNELYVKCRSGRAG